MTDPKDMTRLVERQFDRLREVEDALANGARRADDPECHPLYPHAVAARQIIEREFTTLLERLSNVRKVIEEGYPSQPAKVEQCEHGRYGYEDCITCYDTALLNALDGLQGAVDRLNDERISE